MRMSLASVTLLDGTVISDPMNTQASAAQCLPYKCGADPTNTPAREWCSFWGQSGSLSCVDPSCAPFPVTCPTPALGLPAPDQVQPNLPMLTPSNILQPLPDITAAVAPAPLADDSLWCSLNGAISDNPLLAVMILASAAVLLWPKGRRA
jgi:hypothetical protein